MLNVGILPWNLSYKYYTSYDVDELKHCIWDLNQNLKKFGRTDHEFQTIRNKYNQISHQFVSRIPHLFLDKNEYS